MVNPSVQDRVERVASGSRRKRDLAALASRPPEQWQRAMEASQSERAVEEAKRQQREERLRPRITRGEDADPAWTSARDAIRDAVQQSAYRIWFEPLACIGEVDGALALEAPVGIVRWLERRYGHLIGEAIRNKTDYRGAFLFIAENGGRGWDEGLL